MLGSDGNIYPIPQNYASKSHLVQGSKLKATITGDGKILYKIIEEIEFENKVGLVTSSHDKYQVVSE
jgi:antitoxin component of MazEF toxin-antitoxin module